MTRYALLIEATKNDSCGRVPSARLKGALKVLLRQFSLRCVECREQPEPSGIAQCDPGEAVPPIVRCRKKTKTTVANGLPRKCD